MAKTAHRPKWLKFFKADIDFFELMEQQAQTTLDGLNSLRKWIENDEMNCPDVHELEHKADRQKMELEKGLRDVFVTPFDREDIYDISSLLDLILNGAKRVVKDVEFFQQETTDEYLGKMAKSLVEGGEKVLESIRALDQDLQKAAEAAHQARKVESHVGQSYREGLNELFDQKDRSLRMRSKHLYDSLLLIATRIERLGEKLSHISIKLS